MLHFLENTDHPNKARYRCDCGNELIAFKSNVSRGHTVSCGCVRRATTAARSRTHGHSAGGRLTRAYVAWKNMRGRCNNPATADYKNYGARGIGCDPAWDDFSVFLNDMGEPGPKMTLDRIDNAKGYSKDNCRWASRGVQNLNRRSNVRYEFNGKRLTLAEWSRETGIGRVTLLKRIQRGVPLEVALTEEGYLRWPRPTTRQPA